MSKAEFMKYARMRLDQKKIKEQHKKNDVFAVKESGWRRNGYKVGEI